MDGEKGYIIELVLIFKIFRNCFGFGKVYVNSFFRIVMFCVRYQSWLILIYQDDIFLLVFQEQIMSVLFDENIILKIVIMFCYFKGFNS